MSKQKPVAITHMRLDLELDGPASETGRRVKEINRYLGSQEYALVAARLSAGGTPLTQLLDRGAIGGEEFQAAQDIELAWFALSGALMLKPQFSVERGSPGRRSDWSEVTADIVAQYQRWANHWSARRKTHCDHTLEVVVSAIVDKRPVRTIAEDMAFDHRRIERAIICGLRDYAARAGWVDRKIARHWMDAALQTFCRKAPKTQ